MNDREGELYERAAKAIMEMSGCSHADAMVRVPLFLEATAGIMFPDIGRDEALDRRREELLRRPLPFALHDGAAGLELLIPDDALKDIDEGELDDVRGYAEELDLPPESGAVWCGPELPRTRLPFWALGWIIPVGREFTYNGETFTWLGRVDSYALTMDRIGPRVTLDLDDPEGKYKSVRVLDLEVLAGDVVLVLEGNEVVMVNVGGLG